MEICKTVSELRKKLENQRGPERTVGFVPTMGALHQGHISLVERSKRENELTVVSVFVNPTQFNESSDLEKYPRTLEADSEMLAAADCDFLFAPSVDQVYPEGTEEEPFDFGELDKVLEGQFRPGHFAGVAQVVKRLLEIVEPQHLYLGQKDYQQVAIVRRMIELAELPVEVRMCMIIREPDGLAMSSRNRRLSPELRGEASFLSRTLFKMKTERQDHSLKKVLEWGREQIRANDHFKLEYLEASHPDTLQPLQKWPDDGIVVLSIAAWLDGIRLIDNVLA